MTIQPLTASPLEATATELANVLNEFKVFGSGSDELWLKSEMRGFIYDVVRGIDDFYGDLELTYRNTGVRLIVSYTKSGGVAGVKHVRASAHPDYGTVDFPMLNIALNALTRG